jgi:hypothetical protein
MAIPEHIKSRFDRIQNEAGIALMEVTDDQTGEPRFVICSVLKWGSEFLMHPLGEVFDNDRAEGFYQSVTAPA